jgi:hypothetical protein
MASKTWTLFDQTTDEHVGHGFQVAAKDLSQSTRDFQVQFDVGGAGLSRGVEQVTIQNGRLRFVVLPTRGMSLWKAWHLGGQEEHIGWHSPVRGPVHPSFVPISEPSGLGWLDGFDELLVRCGLESNGAPEFGPDGRLLYPLHGRIGNKPAYRLELTVDGDADELRLTGWVEETRFHFLKLRMKSTFRTRLGSTSIDVEDEIENLSASPAEMQLLYHVNFGQPLLDAGAQALIPAAEIVPRNDHAASGIASWNSYAAETPGYEEQVYFAKLQGDEAGDTSVLLKNAHSTRGVQLRFNTRRLPCFSVWKNTTAAEDGYVTGLEPGTNFPNPRSFEGGHGRVEKLAGRATAKFSLGLDYLPAEAEVAAAEQAVSRYAVAPPTVHQRPLPDWCAG